MGVISHAKKAWMTPQQFRIKHRELDEDTAAAGSNLNPWKRQFIIHNA
jgi:hypothetical protein